MAGFIHVFLGSGGGAGLVPKILECLPALQGRILWPAAVDRSFDMASALKLHGYNVQTIDVYVAQPQLHFSSDKIKPIRDGSVSGVIVMSSRSACLFCKFLNDQGLDSRRANITLIAGSSAIAEAAGSGWRQIHIAKVPRRSRLLAIATLLYHCQRKEFTARMVTTDG